MRARLARLVGVLAERGVLEPDAAVASLEKVLDEGAPASRSAAMRALGRIGADDALAIARVFATEDPDGHVRLIALLSVLEHSDLADGAARGLVVGLLAGDEDARGLPDAAVALGVFLWRFYT